VRAIERYDLDNIAPAGSMYSSVLDMTRWIRFLLAGGRTPAGTRLVSEVGLAELFRPQVLISIGTFYPTSRLTRPHFTAYGMGWFLHDYRGEFAAFHTGSIDGMTALVGLLPERKAGMVIFANLDHAEFRHALMYRVFDQVTGAPARDWSAEFLTLYAGIGAEERTSQARRDSSRVMGTRPSLSLERYAGSYADSLYGKATVREENGHLVFSASDLLTADLEHWQAEPVDGPSTARRAASSRRCVSPA